MSIRRTVHWPVRRIVYGAVYKSGLSILDTKSEVSNRKRLDTPENILISDNYQKLSKLGFLRFFY